MRDPRRPNAFGKATLTFMASPPARCRPTFAGKGFPLLSRVHKWGFEKVHMVGFIRAMALCMVLFASGMLQAQWTNSGQASMHGPAAFARKGETPFRSLQVEQGLPSNHILDLVQDAAGYLWLVTPQGMARFDGLQVEPFGLDLNLSEGGWDPLVPLSNGHWIGRHGTGWVHWDGRRVASTGTALLQALPQEGRMVPDGAGSMLFVHAPTQNPDSLLLRWSDGTWKPVLAPVGHPWHAPVPVGTGKGHAWILDQNPEAALPHLVRVDAQRSRTRPIALPFLPGPGVLEWAAGRILYASPAGPVLLDADGSERLLLQHTRPKRRSEQPRSTWPDAPNHWVLDHADRLWVIGDEAQLSAFQLLRHPLSDSVQLRPLPPLELAETPSDLLLDRDGNLWWGSRNHGATCLPSSNAFVQSLRRSDGLPDEQVRRLAAYQPEHTVFGNVWTGHRAGLIGVFNQTGIGGAGQPVFGSAGIQAIQALAADAYGQAWAGTDDGLFRVRLRRVERMPRMPGARSLVVSMDAEGSSMVFAGGAAGLLAWRNQGKADMPLPAQWYDAPLEALASDGQGGCWGLGQDLVHADPQGLVRVWPGAELPAGRPIDLAYLPPHRPSPHGHEPLPEQGWKQGLKGLVLALKGEGLWWHPGAASAPAKGSDGRENSGFVPLLPSIFRDVVLRDVFAEGDSILWVASNAGLFRLRRSGSAIKKVDGATQQADGAWSMRRYSRSDGLPSNDVQSVLVLDGVVYVGHHRGLSLFRPESLDYSASKPGIRLTGIRINGADTSLAEGTELPHDQNRIQLSYRGIAPGHGHRLHYRYRLDGLDPPGQWHHASDLSVQYAHLQPGPYRFQVEAVDADGTRSLAPDTLAWSIIRPWWRSTWFVLLSILLGFILMAVLYAMALGRRHRRHLERAVSAKTLELDRKMRALERSNEQLEQFAFIASHDLKEPLRNVANYVQWIERRGKGLLTDELVGYLNVAVRGVKRMYGMLDGLLEWSALAREGQAHRRVDGNALLQQVLQNAPKEGRLTIVTETLPDAWGDPGQLALLMEQLVDNAVKFNPSTEAKVHLYGVSRTDEVEWCVADNGPGLDERYADRIYQIFERLVGEDEGYAGHGVGLALCQRIVERHGGRLWYRRTNEGTTFHVILPKAR